MTELEWLKKESGLTDEELKTYETILGDGKFKSMLKKVIDANATLEAAKTKAETELSQFTTRYNEEIVPALRTTTQESVANAGKVAELQAKLAKAKEYGIVIDDEAAPPKKDEPPRAPGSPDPNLVTRETFDNFSRSQSNTILALQDLNAEHFALTGQPLGNTQELVDEVQRQRTLGNKNFTLKQAWEVKYDVSAKRAAKAAEAQAKRDADLKAQWTKEERERTSSNPHTRRGQPSRFSTYKSSDAKVDKPWQSSRSKNERNSNWREQALAKVQDGRAA
jgi:hypothetical protein